MSKSPAFQFYPAEFFADVNVILMSNREIGCYIKLLCICWREGSIPNEINKIAKICGENNSEMAELWLAIKPCFRSAINDQEKLINPRLDEERKKQNKFKKERSETGKKGAKARWNKGSGDNELAIAEPLPQPLAEPMANDGSSSSSLSLSSNNKINNNKTCLHFEKKNKDKDDFLLFRGLLNEFGFRIDQLLHPKTTAMIRAWMKEGVGVDIAKDAIVSVNANLGHLPGHPSYYLKAVLQAKVNLNDALNAKVKRNDREYSGKKSRFVSYDDL